VQFDTTVNEWHTCPQSGRINASNPCSEYMFLDNTACNLASFNLLKFFNSETKQFDTEGYEHGIRIWTVVLEISVLMAAFPSKEIARLSYEFRTLGLGYANIGAMLMQAGIPYDSEEARAVCGALTAILTGRSYATSAEMSQQLGPFPGYYKNREHMLRVIRNHRRAAYGVSRNAEEGRNHILGAYESLEIAPVPIDTVKLEKPSGPTGHLANSPDIMRQARAAWDDALNLGTKHGFRNAQTTVIAPTGTIGLLMDCDTTGVEPDFALVKFKKLAGGGYFKIANQSLEPALVALGYTKPQIADMIRFILGTLTLDCPMPAPDGANVPNAQSFGVFLKEKGLNDADLKKITDGLPALFEISHAFNAYSLGKDAMARLGLTAASEKPNFNLLKALGLKTKQIASLSRIICGTQTVEGAPHLKDEHLAVFDCANTCGPLGERFIAAEGHIRMMAAAQPFISGAISKTINLPNSATLDDIKSSYRLSWELALKANALYRDGCKLSQPLNTKVDADEEDDDHDNVEAGKAEVATEVVAAARAVAAMEVKAPAAAAATVERIVEKVVHRPMRRRLPDTRRSITHKFNVAGHEGYLTVGLYEDGQPGELFLTMAKEGSTIGGLMDSLGTAISVALQYGVPVESLVNKFTHQRFEPAGMTHNMDIPFAKSLVDYIFRWMGMEFVNGYRAANAPKRDRPTQAEAAPAAPAAPATIVPSNANNTASNAAEAVVARSQGNAPGNGNGNGSGHVKFVEAGEAKDAPARAGGGLLDGPRRALTTEPVSESKSSGKASSIQSANSDGGANSTQGALAMAMKEMQADAPACDVCGTITVRSGTCYKCVNCGNSMGCS
jgi:ribonucleoside-diphosphate reductase alpha chain